MMKHFPTSLLLMYFESFAFWRMRTDFLLRNPTSSVDSSSRVR